MLDSYTSQILNFADSHTNSQLWCTIPFQISQSSTYEKLQKYHNFDPFLIARDFADLGNFSTQMWTDGLLCRAKLHSDWYTVSPLQEKLQYLRFESKALLGQVEIQTEHLAQL